MSDRPPITLSHPYPLLDPGEYIAVCTAADFAWARQWKKWISRLELYPLSYTGRPYIGQLCKFMGLGKNPQQPYAGPQTEFRRLLVECNGDQPPSLQCDDLSIFVNREYDIAVETVTKDRQGKPRPPVHWYSIVRSIHPRKRGQ